VLRRRRGEEPLAADRAVLHWAVLGPVALLLALSAATGCQLRDIYASPLWTFTGVWALVMAGAPAPERLRWCRCTWAAVAGGVLTFCVVKNGALPYLTHRPSRVQFPGRRLAAEVGRRWYARCTRPYPIVAGEPWRAGNVCCFSPHRPVIYSSGCMGFLVFEPKHSPWTGDADLAARGGVLLWDADQLGDTVPGMIRARFPTAEGQTPIVLPYQTGAAVDPLRVGVAFVWPPAGERLAGTPAR
jgi:hypothetical protein